ncbi:MAG: MFS transporter, partial [Solirubrobacteraceae bacterium]
TAAVPLLPLSVLASRVVVGANLVFALLVAAMFGFQFLVTLYFQRVLGYTPLQAGLGIFPVAAGIAVMSLVVFPALSRRIAPTWLIVPGLLALAAGMGLLTGVPVHGDYLRHVAPSLALFAIGGGLALPATMTTAMSAVDPAHAGAASGLINTSQQVGGAIGLAVLASLAASHASSLSAHGHATGPALVAGFHLAWTVGAALLAIAAVIAALLVARPSRAGYGAPDRPAEAPVSAA